MSTSTTIIMAIIISFAVSVILCPIVIPIFEKNENLDSILER